MQNKKLENSVRNLLNLYTVAIGIALTLAVSVLIDPKEGLASATLVSTLSFVSFTATLVPFFHGALRHMDDIYIEDQSRDVKEGVLIVDFLLLFLHALAFLVLAQLLKKPADFAWFLTCVLSLDVLWGFIAYVASPRTAGPSAEGRWSLINLVFVSVALLYLLANDVPFAGSLTENERLAKLTLVACVLRSAVDYVWCREFYFPRKS